MFQNEWGGAVAMTKIEGHWMYGPWIMINTERLVDGNWHTNSHECVAIAQETLRMPNAKMFWRRGTRVLGNAAPNYYQGLEVRGTGIARGTIIATFDENGRYLSNEHNNHVAIYISQDKNSIRVIDQWNKRKPDYRTIYIKNGMSDPSNNANAFSVVYSTVGGY